jgi:mRNA interferase MazF
MLTMRNTTSYNFGDIVLVPFPFTDQKATKQRPAVIISSSQYHNESPDVIVMAVTSQVTSRLHAGAAAIAYWKEAGLLKPSLLKPVVATLERKLIIKTLGSLNKKDVAVLDGVISAMLGSAKALR